MKTPGWNLCDDYTFPVFLYPSMQVEGLQSPGSLQGKKMITAPHVGLRLKTRVLWRKGEMSCLSSYVFPCEELYVRPVT